MSQQLAAALGQLNLQPGQVYRTTVNGHEFEVKALEARPISDTEAEFEHHEGPMLEPWFAIPNPPTAGVVSATLDVLPRFDPPIIPSGSHYLFDGCRRDGSS